LAVAQVIAGAVARFIGKEALWTMKTLIESLKIILLCIVAAIVYGILHDQVTARVCVEYFTIGHPPIFHTDDPTLLALGWGVIATW
jgi:hypothetical protein